MKKYVFFLIFVLTAWGVQAQYDRSDFVKVGDRMPSFTIVSDNGTSFSSSSLKGKVVLVTFFATWCPPCQKELAAIQQRLWPKFKDRKDFALLVIGREHSDAELQKYNEKKGFTFPLYPDKSRAVFETFAMHQIPRSYLVGKDGKIIHMSKGYTDEGFAELMKKTEETLK